MTPLAPSDGQVSIFDLGLFPIDVHDDKTAEQAGAWAFSETVKRLNTEPETADEALQRAGDNADSAWAKKAREIVHDLCTSHQKFTTDLIWERLDASGEVTPERRAMVARNGASHLPGQFG